MTGARPRVLLFLMAGVLGALIAFGANADRPVSADGGSAGVVAREPAPGDLPSTPAWLPGESEATSPAPPPPAALNGSLALPNLVMPITYVGDWPDAAKAALQRAVDTWESYLAGAGPIAIKATWSNSNSSVLGYPGSWWTGFTGQLIPETWTPEALVNQLGGLDPTGQEEIYLSVDDTPNVPWWFGEASAPVGTRDLTTYALREIGRGLGFTSSILQSGSLLNFGLGSPSAKFPSVHDYFTVTGGGTPLRSIASGSPALEQAVESGDLFFAGPFAMAANGGIAPKLNSPPAFNSSTFGYLDEATYNGTANALMTPVITLNETIRQPGPLALAMLRDYGYTLVAAPFDATCDGTASGSDGLAVLRALAGFENGLLPLSPCTGDADNSGNVTIHDLLLIRMYLAGF